MGQTGLTEMLPQTGRDYRPQLGWRPDALFPGLARNTRSWPESTSPPSRAKGPGVYIEIRWCPSHQGIEGNEIASEWAKQAAGEPDAHGVEWLDFKDPDGILRMRRFPLPR